MPPPADPATALLRLIEVIDQLRTHCPWMRALTHESLVQYLIEESYELVEAIETGSGDEIKGEVGDILLQVVLHARLAQEVGGFDIADVAQALAEKLIRRSPHVFQSDGSLQDTFPSDIATIETTWHRIKAGENQAGESKTGESKPGEAKAGEFTAGEKSVSGGTESPFHGIPRALPALALAQKSLDRAARARSAAGAGLLDPAGAGVAASGPRTEDELGDVLFAVVRSARAAGLDAERALRSAVRRFQTSEISPG
ncbi:MazG nucleotide pyrophosphohydrolase domain-containing protein [Arthrobacter sp. A5]|uniref:MazG nucleotide pyrophosphohydrolase domain-containing protein n=1 Tax=Arthrobacter sp. A5 TaxID=576926 RepID=UPI003DA8A59B